MSTEHIRQQQLLQWINQSTDFECQQLELVSGDASFRRYFRFLSKGQWIIAVDAPPKVEDCGKFVDVAKAYQAAGLNVPKVYAYDLELGFYCQQDFGEEQFSQALNSKTCDLLYKNALACIPAIQTCRTTERGELPLYDHAFVQREVNIFTQWLLAEYLQLNLSSLQTAMLESSFAFITQVFLSQPMVGVHRDFHSRNLMLLADQSIGVIDFQDAVVGPLTYDGVSLLRDCYQRWPAEKVELWLQEWYQEYFSEYDFKEFKLWFDITGLQRHIKASGIFARLFLRDNKITYLYDIPNTLQYIVEVGREYKELHALANFVDTIVLPAVLAIQQNVRHGTQ
ncbi:phosphotransferase [Paraglaciecola aquimarina]|uniref:Phosphotransferase n=1 Tax=Paraglaciecola algarum TaxID=3050085 RepID=A0ABS9D9S2_9ALTE|nr:phosphotransferase [Paraglaciecola sp. G1-23]MCF2949713.1 phosphotransferase [Paraglaciecola sp. G1-23]